MSASPLHIEHAVQYLAEVLKDDGVLNVVRARTPELFRLPDAHSAVIATGAVAAHITSCKDAAIIVEMRYGQRFVVHGADLELGPQHFTTLVDDWMDEVLLVTGDIEAIEDMVRDATKGDFCLITMCNEDASEPRCKMVVGQHALSEFAMARNMDIDAKKEALLMYQNEFLVVRVDSAPERTRDWLGMHSRQESMDISAVDGVAVHL